MRHGRWAVNGDSPPAGSVCNGKEGSFLLFTSLEFLLTFLPGTLLVYFLIPKKVRNYWLLLVSLFFYTWGAPKFAVFLVDAAKAADDTQRFPQSPKKTAPKKRAPAKKPQDKMPKA